MNNAEFIKRYGKREFDSIGQRVRLKLFMAKNNKEIARYRTNNSKKTVQIVLNDGENIRVDFATIFCYNIGDIIKKWKNL